jgi:hypothetical protein
MIRRHLYLGSRWSVCIRTSNICGSRISVVIRTSNIYGSRVSVCNRTSDICGPMISVWTCPTDICGSRLSVCICPTDICGPRISVFMWSADNYPCQTLLSAKLNSPTMEPKVQYSNAKQGCLPRLWIEHRTFRSSVWRSPNWAIAGRDVITCH